MCKNSNHAKARKNKNNEYYTTFEFALKELQEYGERGLFRGKTIYCPCDDPRWSNILRVLVAKRPDDKWGIKEIYCSFYVGSDNQKLTECVWVIGDKNKRPEIVNNNEWHKISDDAKEVRKQMLERGWEIPVGTRIGRAERKLSCMVKGNNYIPGIESGELPMAFKGDFRADEARELAKHCDIIITNPPFTCKDFDYASFLNFCLESGKKFLVLGSNVAVNKKNVFELYKKGLFWGGYNCDTSEKFYTTSNLVDEESSKVPVTWYTNMPVMENIMCYESGKKIDDIKKVYYWSKNTGGYKIAEGEKVLYLSTYKDYPDDYYGVVGIPSNAFYRFNSKYFEVLYPNQQFGQTVQFEDGTIGDVSMRIYIRRKRNVKDVNLDTINQNIKEAMPTLSDESGLGYVYIIVDEHERFKVGVTKQAIEARLGALQTGNADELSTYFISKPISNYFEIEKELHTKLSGVHIRLEWFRDIKNAKEKAKQLIKALADINF